MRIKPKYFWENFKNEFVKRKRKNPKFMEKYSLNKDWTIEVKDLIEDFAYNIMSCKSSVKEYWPKLDIAIFDKCQDEEWSEWALEVAVEVENNIKTVKNEIRKLMLINAGLKVLITYYISNDEIDNILTETSKIYKSRKYYTENDTWLFIFAPIWRPEKMDNWIVYKFSKNKFDKIDECNI